MRDINTERLVLKPLTGEDKTMFYQLYTDELTMAYIARPYSDEKVKKSFKSACNFNNNSERLVKTWAIELIASEGHSKLKSKQTIGIVMLYDEFNQQRLSVIEIGILLQPNATGMSYGKEALAGLLSYCFNDLAISQVNIRFHPNNLAMRTIAKKLGFITTVALEKNSTINSADKANSKDKISIIEKQMWVQQLYATQWQAH